RPIERHADGSAEVWTLVQLVADRVAGPAFAVAAGIAVLHDEIGHDAVNAETVEESLSSQRDEILDRHRRVEDRQLNLNRAASAAGREMEGVARSPNRYASTSAAAPIAGFSSPTPFAAAARTTGSSALSLSSRSAVAFGAFSFTSDASTWGTTR